jgi:hypothetical protein
MRSSMNASARPWHPMPIGRFFVLEYLACSTGYCTEQAKRQQQCQTLGQSTATACSDTHPYWGTYEINIDHAIEVLRNLVRDIEERLMVERPGRLVDQHRERDGGEVAYGDLLRRRVLDNLRAEVGAADLTRRVIVKRKHTTRRVSKRLEKQMSTYHHPPILTPPSIRTCNVQDRQRRSQQSIACQLTLSHSPSRGSVGWILHIVEQKRTKHSP